MKYIKWKEATSKQKKVRILSYTIYLFIMYTGLSIMTFAYTVPALDSISQFLLANVTNVKAPVSFSFAVYFLSVIIVGSTGPSIFLAFQFAKHRHFVSLLLLKKFKLDSGLIQPLEHSVIVYEGKKIIVCNGHFCNKDGVEVTKEV